MLKEFEEIRKEAESSEEEIQNVKSFNDLGKSSKSS